MSIAANLPTALKTPILMEVSVTGNEHYSLATLAHLRGGWGGLVLAEAALEAPIVVPVFAGA
jgi:hypothetical protein